MITKKDPILSDLGEFRILYEIVIPSLKKCSKVSPIGDDCASIEIPSGSSNLVLTSDAGPKPLVWQLGLRSYWSWGWYSVLTSVSDLASAGAFPLAFTTSVEAQPNMSTDSFESFFRGISDACCEFSISNAGGNIRTAEKFACHGTAIGYLKNSQSILKRSMCKLGDVFVSIGNCGLFITTYLKAKKYGLSELTEEEKKLLINPDSQIVQMQILNSDDILSAASDNSDGVLGCLWNICEASNCSIVINMDNINLDEDLLRVSKEGNLNPWNLFFFWGDWQIIVSVKREKFSEFLDVATKQDFPYTVLGEAQSGPPALHGLWNNKKYLLKVLRNEEFALKSHSISIKHHVDFMLRENIFAEL